MSLLEIKGLNFCYGPKPGFCLKDINLTLEKGGVTALIGPNGAGKTTLVKIMAGINRSFSGQVLLDGKDSRSFAPESAAKLISYVPQADNYIFDFSVYDIVAMGRRPYINEAGILGPLDRKVVDETLVEFGLDAKKHSGFNSLSGGEKRMVLIARAIAQQTPLLLMDEPTTYLDLRHQAGLMEMTARLNKAGKTVFMISHSVNLASEYVKRVILMDNGRIAADGAPGEVINEGNMRDIYKLENFYLDKNRVTGRPNLFLVPK